MKDSKHMDLIESAKFVKCISKVIFNTSYAGYLVKQFLGFTFMVLNNAFVFHLGFKFEDKMHKSKNNENKLVSDFNILRYFTRFDLIFIFFQNFGIFKNVFKPDMKRKYPKSNRQCIEPKPKSRRGGVSEVNMGGRAEVKFGSKMTQNGLTQEERERLKKAHTERLAKMNQPKPSDPKPSDPVDLGNKPSETKSDSKPVTKTEEIINKEAEIPVTENDKADLSENAEENNEKTVEINNEIDEASDDKDGNEDIPP